jgi:hypothetical protein
MIVAAVAADMAQREIQQELSVDQFTLVLFGPDQE